MYLAKIPPSTSSKVALTKYSNVHFELPLLIINKEIYSQSKT
jgi:hypothetical protein